MEIVPQTITMPEVFEVVNFIVGGIGVSLAMVLGVRFFSVLMVWIAEKVKLRL